MGATQASAGVLAPYIEANEGGPLLDLTLRSLALYDRWIDLVRAGSGREVEYRRSGSLEVALAAATEAARRSGLEESVVLLAPACASYDQFANFEARGDTFRALARAAAGATA